MPTDSDPAAASQAATISGRVPAAPTMTVIVPVDRADEAFRRCLTNLTRLDPAPAELIVVVDGGDQATAELAGGHGARVVVLPEQRGPAAARNAGARTARGAVLFFTDADVLVPADTLARVAVALSAPPACDAVIGSYDQSPGAPNFLSQYKNLVHHFVHQASNEDACTFWSACGAMTRDAFERTGGFDERYGRPSIEDIELGSRVLARGCRIRLAKSLQATHLKRWTPGRLLRTDVFDRAIPWTRLILRTGRMPNDLNLRWSGRLAVAVACALAVSLAASPWFRWAQVASVAFAALEVCIDARLARFFFRARGPMFAARALAWQWVHYLCCAAGFAAGFVLHLAESAHSRATAHAAAAAPAAPDSESR